MRSLDRLLEFRSRAHYIRAGQGLALQRIGGPLWKIRGGNLYRGLQGFSHDSADVFTDLRYLFFRSLKVKVF